MGGREKGGGSLIEQREKLSHRIVLRSQLTFGGTLMKTWPFELGFEFGPLCPLTSLKLLQEGGMALDESVSASRQYAQLLGKKRRVDIGEQSQEGRKIVASVCSVY